MLASGLSPQRLARDSVAASNSSLPLVADPPAASQRKIQRAAHQFEAQLLTSLLASLETSLGSVPGSEDSGVGAQYRSLATQNLASAWADAGGIGIARILTRALSKGAQSELPASLPMLPADLLHGDRYP